MRVTFNMEETEWKHFKELAKQKEEGCASRELRILVRQYIRENDKK